MYLRLLAAATAVSITCIGCGSGSGDPVAPSKPSSSTLRGQLKLATASTVADFPAVERRTLDQVATALDGTGPLVGLATSVFTPGVNRLAFGVIDKKTGFVYGKTAVYVASTPGARARGPYPAPADLLITDAPYRSETSATEKDHFVAVYAAQVPFSKPGKYAVLVAINVNGKLVGATTVINVVAKSKDSVVAVGKKAPKVATDTVASAGGDVASIDTRIPPSTMHENSLKDVLGQRPVALLFATSALCQSRVCGPVVDIAEQLKAKYGDRMEFIHQEVYVGNKISNDLRPALKAFGLSTEPWLFVIDRNGEVVERLEGSFGFSAFEQAVKAGL